MQRRKQRILLAMTVVCWCVSDGVAQQVVHDAQGFECGFIYGRAEREKSGDATCSYNVERVFSSKVNPLPPTLEHCKTEEVFEFKDLRLKIDLTKKTVVFKRDEGLAPFAMKEMIDYYM